MFEFLRIFQAHIWRAEGVILVSVLLTCLTALSIFHRDQRIAQFAGFGFTVLGLLVVVVLGLNFRG